MRTQLFFAATASTMCLSQVNAATLSSFPVYDEELDFAQQADSLWTTDEFSQNDMVPTLYSEYGFQDEVPDLAETGTEIDIYARAHTHAYMQNTLDALAAIQACTDCEWWDGFDKIGAWVAKGLEKIEEMFKGTANAIINIASAVAAIADNVLLGVPGAIINMINHSKEIMMILKKDMKDITPDDIATLVSTVPILGDVVKSFSKAK